MRTLAAALGLVFALAGVAGFIPAWTPEGNLFGIFAVDGARNGLNFATGIFGIGMGISGTAQAASYFRILGIVYAVLTAAGLLLLRTGELMGMALNEADLMLQAGVASFALVMGFVGQHPPLRARRAY